MHLSLAVFNAAYGDKACLCPHGLPELLFAKVVIKLTAELENTYAYKPCSGCATQGRRLLNCHSLAGLTLVKCNHRPSPVHLLKAQLGSREAKATS